MARNRSVAQYITQYAKKHGVDPRAALAVAMTEGGIKFGAVGDQGTSFGPFQLHRGGALPRGRGAAWANSPAGLEYAIRAMANAGARGLKGREAINAIVRRFERPADPNSQVAKALNYYGSTQPISGAPLQPVADTASPLSGDANKFYARALLRASSRGNYKDLLNAAQYVRDLRDQELDDDQTKNLTTEESASPTRQNFQPYKGGGRPVREAFYDPMGAYDEGSWISPIGGHSDHVHVSFGNPQEAIKIMKKAQSMGLRVGENAWAGDPAESGIHTPTSYHYKTFRGKYGGKKVGAAADISGTSRQMGAFYKWLQGTYLS